jgi:hypothetical protein
MVRSTSGFWQGEPEILQALDESRAAQVRTDPGAETHVKRLALIPLVGNFTQFASHVRGFVVTCSRSTLHR